MKTTIQKLIDDNLLDRVHVRYRNPYGLQNDVNVLIEEYRPADSVVLSYVKQPYASDLIELVTIVRDPAVNRVEAKLVSMASNPHTKYVNVNNEIEIKVFRLEG